MDEILEIATKVDMEVSKLEELKNGFRALEADVAEKTLGNGISPLGASGDFTGVSPVDASMMRSACAKMQWAYDNTGLDYIPFFKLHRRTPTQGIEIWKGLQFDEKGKIISGTLVDTIVVPITGGMDGDPTKQISQDMYTMIGLLLTHAYNLTQNEK